MQDKLESFIDKMILEYQEHFKKGNRTLGTLPSDWKIELIRIGIELCEEQKKECAKSDTSNFDYEFLVHSNDEVGYSGVTTFVNKDSILNSKNVCG